MAGHRHRLVLRSLDLRTLQQVAGLNFPATCSTVRYYANESLFLLLSIFSFILFLCYITITYLIGYRFYTTALLLLYISVWLLLPVWMFGVIAKRGLSEGVCNSETFCRLPLRVMLYPALLAFLVPLAQVLNLWAYFLGGSAELWGISQIMLHSKSKAGVITVGINHFICAAIWVRILCQRIDVHVQSDEQFSARAGLLLIDQRALILGLMSIGFHAFGSFAAFIRLLVE